MGTMLRDVKDVERAVKLINLGARLQVLTSETSLSSRKLLQLYKEVAGKSPVRGLLPFSTDWFMTWQPNAHASLFLNIYEYLREAAELDAVDTIIKAYSLYVEQTQARGLEPILSVTRAWRLVKFFKAGMVAMTACTQCGGCFVTHPHEIAKRYVCGLCKPPGRAGKQRASLRLEPNAEPSHSWTQ